MKKIKNLVDWINDELCGAQQYAEKYVEHKAKGTQWAGKFRAMAEDELKHAEVIHAYTMEEIKMIEQVFKAPAEMQEAWEKSHVHYVDKAAWIKQMLNM